MFLLIWERRLRQRSLRERWRRPTQSFNRRNRDLFQLNGTFFPVE
jgi:hypothetical protein